VRGDRLDDVDAAGVARRPREEPDDLRLIIIRCWCALYA
jgi:hypothetical protein